VKEDGQVVVGNKAVGLNINFLLKTAILAQVVGLNSKFFKHAPGRPDFVRTLNNSLFRLSDIDKLLDKHLEYIF
jgi:predicted alpha/beta-hydrolase family hydrolase